MRVPVLGRQGRLLDELRETGIEVRGSPAYRTLLLEEIDHALRPPVHERRVMSGGTILDPATAEPDWAAASGLAITRIPCGSQPLPDARRFADGQSSWLLRRSVGGSEWLVFDRPAGSERDTVVLAAAFGATLVQRDPSGTVRIVGDFGVLRWDGLSWHHEPPVEGWLETIHGEAAPDRPEVLRAMLEFAVHDLGALGIGSILVLRRDDDLAPLDERLPAPPRLEIRRVIHLAPLRHALAQVDGAAIFDSAGRLEVLGARLVPSPEAEQTVDAYGGTRHTSARRYSRDHPSATIVVVSEDGPVSVFRDGEPATRAAAPASRRPLERRA